MLKEGPGPIQPFFFPLPAQICRGGQVTPTLGPNACTALFIVEMEIKSLVAITSCCQYSVVF